MSFDFSWVPAQSPPEPPADPSAGWDVADDKDLTDSVGSEALQNEFLRSRSAALDEGLFKLEGGAALDAAPAAGRQLQEMRDGLLERAASPRQRAMLASDLDAHLDVAREAIGRHVARQAEAWDQAVRAERLGLLQQQAGREWDDQAKLALYGDIAAASAGDDPEAGSQARSGVWRSAIDAALSEGAHGAALDLHKSAVDHLTPQDAADLEAELAIAGQMQAGRDYLARLLPQPMPATPAETDEAHAAALQRNAGDWGDDPEQQATNKHLIDVRFGLHRRGLQQAEAERAQAVQDWLSRTDSDGNPQVERPPPSLWKRLDPAQRQYVDAQLAANARGDTSSQQAQSEASPDVSLDGMAKLAPANERFDDTSMSSMAQEETASDTPDDPAFYRDGAQLAQVRNRPPRRSARASAENVEELSPLESARLDSFRSYTDAIRELEPHNAILSYIAPRGWVPSQRAVDVAREELLSARQRAAERAARNDQAEPAESRAKSIDEIRREADIFPRPDPTTRYNDAIELLRKIDPETRLKPISLGAAPPTERDIQEAQTALGFALRRDASNWSNSRQSPQDRSQAVSEGRGTIEIRGKLLPRPEATPADQRQAASLSSLDGETQTGMRRANYAQPR